MLSTYGNKLLYLYLEGLIAPAIFSSLSFEIKRLRNADILVDRYNQ